jgi:fumarylacetoacetate (FAA) hydrolase
VKLARYRDRDGDGQPRVGVVDGGTVTAIATAGTAAADGGQAALLAAAMASTAPAVEADPVDLATVALLAPVPRPPAIRDFYAFEEHVATARRTRGLDVQPEWYEEPVFYFTNPAVVRGPDDVVRGPAASRALDFELEVAAVIGVECADVASDAWLDVVAGFTVMNDWSARDLQAREMRVGLGPAKGKDFATSLGPVLVTPDELAAVESGRPAATMVARVNGQEWSRGELAAIHFSWGEIIAHASRDTVLRPGDVIGSGTVGTGCILELSAVHGSERYPWLASGDVVECEVAGIGILRNTVA